MRSMQPKENKAGYASARQRELLLALSPLLPDFFLTGGTALSVFYLHHRVSEDLDFFTNVSLETYDLPALLKEKSSNFRILRQAESFISAIADGVKVDFVNSQLELDFNRIQVAVDGSFITVDAFENIFANKLTTLISRGDPKDFIDFHCASTAKQISRDELLRWASQKEARFDDPADVAYWIENNIATAKSRKDWPPMLIPFEQEACFKTATEWVKYLYDKGRKDAGL